MSQLIDNGNQGSKNCNKNDNFFVLNLFAGIVKRFDQVLKDGCSTIEIVSF